MILVLYFIVIFFCASAFGTEQSAPGGVDEFNEMLSMFARERPRMDNQVILNRNREFRLGWTVDFANESIEFSLTVNTIGWIGFGLSPKGGMLDADIVVGWVSGATQTAYLTDRHGVGKREPVQDMQEDYELLQWQEIDGWTYLRFRRDFKTCDPHDVDIDYGTMRVIWAYNDKSPDMEESEGELIYHVKRGSRSVNLLQAPQPTLEEDEETETLKIIHDSIELPSEETTYLCRGFELPEELAATKHHMVKAAPVVQEGNEKYVHHLLLYECPNELNATDLAYEGDCQAAPDNLRECNFVKPIVVWAVGGDDFVLPPNVGLPIGGADGGPRQYVLEIHYDNPDMDEGVVDSSGVELTYTSNLREHDAGIFVTGAIVSDQLQVIPPGEEVTLSTFCRPKCTNLLPHDLNVFASFLHTHLLGRAIYVRHYDANGTELPLLNADPTYDFDFQETIRFWDEKTVSPGDTLVTTCVYRGEGIDEAAVGGLGTHNEMCLHYMHYWPAVPELVNCLELPHPSLLTSLSEQGVFDNVDPDLVMGLANNSIPGKQFWPVHDIDYSDFGAKYDRARRESETTGISVCMDEHGSEPVDFDVFALPADYSHDPETLASLLDQSSSKSCDNHVVPTTRPCMDSYKAFCTLEPCLFMPCPGRGATNCETNFCGGCFAVHKDIITNQTLSTEDCAEEVPAPQGPRGCENCECNLGDYCEKDLTCLEGVCVTLNGAGKITSGVVLMSLMAIALIL